MVGVGNLLDVSVGELAGAAVDEVPQIAGIDKQNLATIRRPGESSGNAGLLGPLSDFREELLWSE